MMIMMMTTKDFFIFYLDTDGLRNDEGAISGRIEERKRGNVGGGPEKGD